MEGSISLALQEARRVGLRLGVWGVGCRVHGAGRAAGCRVCAAIDCSQSYTDCSCAPTGGARHARLQRTKYGERCRLTAHLVCAATAVKVCAATDCSQSPH